MSDIEAQDIKELLREILDKWELREDEEISLLNHADLENDCCQFPNLWCLTCHVPINPFVVSTNPRDISTVVHACGTPSPVRVPRYSSLLGIPSVHNGCTMAAIWLAPVPMAHQP